MEAEAVVELDQVETVSVDQVAGAGATGASGAAATAVPTPAPRQPKFNTLPKAAVAAVKDRRKLSGADGNPPNHPDTHTHRDPLLEHDHSTF